MKKDMSLEGLRWSCDSGSALYDTPPNGRSRTGWGGGYCHLANMKRFLMETDEWLRRRLRMCIWKSWKRVKTRVANLVKCGIDKYQAYMWGNSRLGYWRIAGSYILCRAITSEKLSMASYVTLTGSYLECYPK